MRLRIHGLPILLTAALLAAAAPAWAARDVILVLDNSGSMQRNDPARLAAVAVREFIKSQPADTRIGIVLFAESAEMVAPLTPVDDDPGEALLAALARLDYRGRWTQTARAVERALYELRQQGRPASERAIVLLTDGLIDTGDARRDADLKQWLETNLAPQAKREEIRIFGIAFTERADYQLLQSLAAATGAEYFRVLKAEDLSPTLRKIDQTLAIRAAPPAPATRAPAADSVAPDAPAPAAPAPSGEQSSAVMAWLASGLAAAIAVALLVLAWRRRARSTQAGLYRRPSDPPGPRAVLVDLLDPSGPRRYEVAHRPVVIGRKAGTDPGQDYVIVPDKTVGRWHATILRRGQSFSVRDENSVNGTFVNNERILGEHPLKHSDIVRVHGHTFEFQIPELADSESTVMLAGR